MEKEVFNRNILKNIWSLSWSYLEINLGSFSNKLNILKY